MSPNVSSDNVCHSCQALLSFQSNAIFTHNLWLREGSPLALFRMCFNYFLKWSLYHRLASNWRPSCLSLPSAEITAVHLVYHVKPSLKTPPPIKTTRSRLLMKHFPENMFHCWVLELGSPGTQLGLKPIR